MYTSEVKFVINKIHRYNLLIVTSAPTSVHDNKNNKNNIRWMLYSVPIIGLNNLDVLS